MAEWDHYILDSGKKESGRSRCQLH